MSCLLILEVLFKTIFVCEYEFYIISKCRVLTPYYTEEVLFSLPDLEEPNEDGVSILFYLQKIFPGLCFDSISYIIFLILYQPELKLHRWMEQLFGASQLFQRRRT